MRIELDAEYDILYIELREGDVERTEDLDDGVHMDLDAEGRVLGLEFISMEAFHRYLALHDGRVEIPDVVEDETTLCRQRFRNEQERLQAELEVAIASRTPRQQAILRLRFYEGLTLAEIAQELGIAESMVFLQLRRTLTDLRRELAGKLAADEGTAPWRLEECLEEYYVGTR